MAPLPMTTTEIRDRPATLPPPDHGRRHQGGEPASISIRSPLTKRLRSHDERHIEYEACHKKGDIVNLFFDEFCEDKMIQPTFIMDHPIEISP